MKVLFYVVLEINIDSNISSTGSNVNIHSRYACTAIEHSSITWKSDFSNKIERVFF